MNRGNNVLQRLVFASFHEVYDAIHVEGGDGFLAGIGLQVGQGDFTVHETVFRQYGGAVCVFQDVDRRLEIWIAVSVVSADVVAWKMFTGLLVQAVS